MKKSINAALAALVFAIVGCGTDAEVAQPQDTGPAVAQPSQPAVARAAVRESNQDPTSQQQGSRLGGPNPTVELVCQFGGDRACSVECIAKGYSHGGHCNSDQVCICNPS